jgi:hypothetical protein
MRREAMLRTLTVAIVVCLCDIEKEREREREREKWNSRRSCNHPRPLGWP